jgi:hypothetical protein
MYLDISCITKAYPLQPASKLSKSSLCWRFWRPDRWQREISVPVWTPDTWHITERSWWLAWCFSQVDIAEVYRSPPSIAFTASPVQISVSYMIRPDKSSNISYQLRRIAGSKQTHNFESHYNKSTSYYNLTHPYMVIQLFGREWKASVWNTHCICHRDCWNIDCMPPVTRKKQSLCEDAYPACTSWLWEMSMSEISMTRTSYRTQYIPFQHIVPRICSRQCNLNLLKKTSYIQWDTEWSSGTSVASVTNQL